MTLRLYNTCTRKKEEFKPIQEGKVGIYVCGVTVYDSCHVGHARSAVVFDVITRYLRHRGYEVTFVKNFTDVDDKIIDKAKASGLPFSEIAERYIREHNEDMDALGVERPTVTPRATDHIGGMIKLIQELFGKGLAYQADGDVYYAVEKFPSYGKLSGRGLDDMMAGARVDVNEKKKNPLDFALWKASKEGEPWWESPWGKGRPGWHIECSVMSREYLGETFDIHGGGEDLVFPHHENEIAQSEGASGKPLAHYWIHNGFVRINSEKMSKSLGNVCTIKDMLGGCHPEALRLFMLQSHYRSPVDYADDSLAEAKLGLDRLYSTMKGIKDTLAGETKSSSVSVDDLPVRHREVLDRIDTYPDRFAEAMDDDFNTARAMGYLFDAVRIVNAYLAEERSAVSSATLFVLHRARKHLEDTGRVLGLLGRDPDEYFLCARDSEASKRGLAAGEIERLIEERQEARAAKNWARADEIRRTLAEKNVILQDTGATTTWKIE
jgi:cysteinyl-tRNA synthetase